jgi:hypothetical protein
MRLAVACRNQSAWTGATSWARIGCGMCRSSRTVTQWNAPERSSTSASACPRASPQGVRGAHQRMHQADDRGRRDRRDAVGGPGPRGRPRQRRRRHRAEPAVRLLRRQRPGYRFPRPGRGRRGRQRGSQRLGRQDRRRRRFHQHQPERAKVVYAGTFAAGMEVRTGDGRLRIVKEGPTCKSREHVLQVTFNGSVVVASTPMTKSGSTRGLSLRPGTSMATRIAEDTRAADLAIEPVVRGPVHAADIGMPVRALRSSWPAFPPDNRRDESR